MKVSIQHTPLPDCILVSPEIFEDHRGFFTEVYRQDEYAAVGLPTAFVQLNHSRSGRNVTRGLHFQWEPPMGKLMRVLSGAAFLVAVDIRKGSPTLGKWFGVELEEKSRKLLWAPPGFARGFCVLSEWAEIEYLTTGTYNKNAESGILWNDPAIGVQWPVTDPILADRDRTAQTLAQWLVAPESRFFRYGDG
jgi:dTDP-4-dehydrorhamnose 3,5-epimerase